MARIAGFFSLRYDAAEGSARARARDERVDLPVHVAPDLRPRRLVVGARVRRVVELPEDDRAGRRCGDFVRRLLREEHPVGARRAHDFRAERPEERNLLAGELVGDHKDDAVAASQRGERDADAGVAGRALDDGSAFLQGASPLGVVDHGASDAVLHAAARVREFQLRVELRAFGNVETTDPHQRSVADELLV